MRGLARAMTLKYGFLGLAQGGAKAGVRGDPEAPLEERRRCLGEFGRAIAPLLLGRTFVPGTDMGTDNADIAWLLAAAGRRLAPRELRGTQSGYYTALSVALSAREATKHIGLELSACRVAIEGLGRVGSPLATLLRAAGARVVAVSTSRGAIYDPEGLDVERLVALGTRAGQPRGRGLSRCGAPGPRRPSRAARRHPVSGGAPRQRARGQCRPDRRAHHLPRREQSSHAGRRGPPRRARGPVPARLRDELRRRPRRHDGVCVHGPDADRVVHGASPRAPDRATCWTKPRGGAWPRGRLRRS